MTTRKDPDLSQSLRLLALADVGQFTVPRAIAAAHKTFVRVSGMRAALSPPDVAGASRALVERILAGGRHADAVTAVVDAETAQRAYQVEARALVEAEEIAGGRVIA